jgi:hypothetical protein
MPASFPAVSVPTSRMMSASRFRSTITPVPAAVKVGTLVSSGNVPSDQASVTSRPPGSVAVPVAATGIAQTLVERVRAAGRVMATIGATSRSPATTSTSRVALPVPRSGSLAITVRVRVPGLPYRILV